MASTARHPNVAYNGALTVDRGALVLVDALAHPDFPSGWGAILAGDVSPPALLAELQSRPGWSRVDYRGVVSPTAARDLLRECRVGIVLSQRRDSYLESLPTKMFEFFAAGLPVVASDFPAWRPIVLHPDKGTLVDESSPAAVARAVSAYAHNEVTLNEQSRNASVAAVTQLNWASEEQLLLALYARVLG